MYIIRVAAPPRGELCSIAVRRPQRWLCLGDVTSIVNGLPWLPFMAKTKVRKIAHRQFVDIGSLQGWVQSLNTAEYKSEARALERLVEWARTVNIAELVPTGKPPA